MLYLQSSYCSESPITPVQLQQLPPPKNASTCMHLYACMHTTHTPKTQRAQHSKQLPDGYKANSQKIEMILILFTFFFLSYSFTIKLSLQPKIFSGNKGFTNYFLCLHVPKYLGNSNNVIKIKKSVKKLVCPPQTHTKKNLLDYQIFSFCSMKYCVDQSRREKEYSTMVKLSRI